MKIVISDALVTAVTGHAEKNGEERVPGGKSLTFSASVHPRVLAELDENLPTVLYDEDEIPCIEGLGPIEWIPEYEKALFSIGLASDDRKDDLQFTAATVKKIGFLVRPGFLADIWFTVKVNANKKQHGELDYLLQQKVAIGIKKATQIPLRPSADEEEKGKGKQPELPEIKPLLDKEGEPAAGRAKH
jgi:hypothetical protein